MNSSTAILVVLVFASTMNCLTARDSSLEHQRYIKPASSTSRRQLHTWPSNWNSLSASYHSAHDSFWNDLQWWKGRNPDDSMKSTPAEQRSISGSPSNWQPNKWSCGTLECNAEFTGDVIKTLSNVPDATACCTECQRNLGCNAWVFCAVHGGCSSSAGAVMFDTGRCDLKYQAGYDYISTDKLPGAHSRGETVDLCSGVIYKVVPNSVRLENAATPGANGPPSTRPSRNSRSPGNRTEAGRSATTAEDTRSSPRNNSAYPNSPQQLPQPTFEQRPPVTKTPKSVTFGGDSRSSQIPSGARTSSDSPPAPSGSNANPSGSERSAQEPALPSPRNSSPTAGSGSSTGRNSSPTFSQIASSQPANGDARATVPLSDGNTEAAMMCDPQTDVIKGMLFGGLVLERLVTPNAIACCKACLDESRCNAWSWCGNAQGCPSSLGSSRRNQPSSTCLVKLQPRLASNPGGNPTVILDGEEVPWESGLCRD